MKKLGLHEVKKEFLDFFREKDHLVGKSFPLVPKNDNSLLLINAGMAPLKPYFTGEVEPPRRKMATCQKCVRTGDIENVGKTDRHATFFEMLGNFSFGDYFKEEAIEFAWEFMTERLEVPKDKIWVTIYEDDDEAYKIWNDKIGIEDKKIVRLGKEDNFWELEVGPCGPCSEIYIDRGEKHGCGRETCKPGCECDRYVEVWNLVFSQFDKDENGNYNNLKNKNIDTGMGLERMAAVLEGADNIFEVEEIKKVISEVESATGISYGKDKKTDESIRVVTDHIRAMTFLISDGVLPSNEGRGYVLRRLIRRAARHGKLLGIERAFLSELSSIIIKLWSDDYPELSENEEKIKKVIKVEEEKFQETIDQGINILDDYIEEMKENGDAILSGDKAFKLYDTYGFPLDLTKEILEEKNLKVEENEFNIEMEEQRNRARKAREGVGNGAWSKDDFSHRFKSFNTTFRGYEHTKHNSEIIGIFVKDEKVSKINEGEEGIILLNETPFYGEGGGQVGDTGTINGDNFEAKVLDTKKTKDNVIFHFVKVLSGEIEDGKEVVSQVDISRRNDIARNHSATHLLHRALKDVLGDHVNQAGSIVLPNRLRFDFTHFESINQEDLAKIEQIVNEKILKQLKVSTIETTLEEAKKMGATALFDEKYGGKVRVIKMSDYSMELCGGTHIDNTGKIGLFKILSESGIASGVRRIEAITGRAVYEYLLEIEEQIDSVSKELKTNRKYVVEKAKDLTEELKKKEKEIESYKGKMASSLADKIIDEKQIINGINVLIYNVDNMDMNGLRNLGDEIKNTLNTGIIVLASVKDEKVFFVTMVTKDLVKKGYHAGKIIKEVAAVTGGSGGGRPDMAQAGGKDSESVNEALELVKTLI